MIVPTLLRIKIVSEERRSINLYIPMIILYLLLLPLIVIALVVLLIVTIVNANKYRLPEIAIGLYKLLCCSRGLDIKIFKENSEVILSII